MILQNGWKCEVVTPVVLAQSGVVGDGSTEEVTGLPSSEEWEPVGRTLLESPESLCGYQALKVGTRSFVLSATVETHFGPFRFVAKMARATSMVKRIGDWFRVSKARRGFQQAMRLIRAGVHTPQPLVILESRNRGESWLITPFVDGLIDLDDIVLCRWPSLTTAELRRSKRMIGEVVAEFFATFHQAGLSHRDLKASNIMIQNWDGQVAAPQVWLIDLEGLQPNRAVNGRQALSRLASSLLEYDQVTRTDYARFLQAYLKGVGRDSSQWRNEFRTLSEMAQTRRQRAGRRKAHKLDGYAGAS